MCTCTFTWLLFVKRALFHALLSRAHEPIFKPYICLFKRLTISFWIFLCCLKRLTDRFLCYFCLGVVSRCIRARGIQVAYHIWKSASWFDLGCYLLVFWRCLQKTCFYKWACWLTNASFDEETNVLIYQCDVNMNSLIVGGVLVPL